MPPVNKTPALETLGDPMATLPPPDDIDELFKRHAEERKGKTTDAPPDEQASGEAQPEEKSVETSGADDKAKTEPPQEQVIDVSIQPKERADDTSSVASLTDASGSSKEDTEPLAETPKESAEDAHKSEELYPDVQLPQNVKGASARAFAEVKARAAKDIAEREEKIRALQKELDELKSTYKDLPSKEEIDRLRKEYEALQEWRAKLDIEADPKFVEKYDRRIEQITNTIYDALAQAGVSEEAINRIKEYGGPTQIDWAPVFEKLGNPTLQRIISKKVDEIEELQLERQAEINRSKADIRKYIDERRKEFEEASRAHQTATEKELGELLKQQEYLQKYELDAAENAEERKRFEEHNKWVDEVHAVVNEALKDSSPSMRALLIAGVAQHMYLRRQYSQLEKERDALKKQVDELSAKLNRIKAASRAAVQSSSAPRTQEPLPETPVEKLYNKTAEEAFEEYLRRRQTERQIEH